MVHEADTTGADHLRDIVRRTVAALALGFLLVASQAAEVEAAGVGAISGVVLDASGNQFPAPGRAYVYREGSTTPFAFSDADTAGRYTLAGLAPGRYLVQFEAVRNPGIYVNQFYDRVNYPDQATVVTVTDGATVTGVNGYLRRQRRPVVNFDGNSTNEVAIYRPSTGEWWVQGGSPQTTIFGGGDDIPVPGDYDGNGRTDKAVYRPSTGEWYVLGQATVVFGLSTDIPVPADYDGDGRIDRAVYRPSTGQWFVLGQPTSVFGTASDVPVPADYNGDGRDEVAVYRPSTGEWHITGRAPIVFGNSTDIPVPADYKSSADRDTFQAAIAVYRPSTGEWFTLGQPTVVFGEPGDRPVSLDYTADSDIQVDRAVQRPGTGVWWIDGGTPAPSTFGTATDIPLALPYAIRRAYFPSL